MKIIELRFAVKDDLSPGDLAQQVYDYLDHQVLGVMPLTKWGLPDMGEALVKPGEAASDVRLALYSGKAGG